MENDTLLAFLVDDLNGGRQTMPETGQLHSGDIGDMGDGVSSHEPAPLRLVDGFKVPDYAAWCASYWRGCKACPDYMADKVRFCRKWNRTFGEKDYTPDRGPQRWPVMATLNDRFGASCLTSEQMDAGAGAVLLCWDSAPAEKTKREALRYARQNWRELLHDMGLNETKYRTCRTWCGEVEK